jgi:uncharacterized protein (TIGR02147 family)
MLGRDLHLSMNPDLVDQLKNELLKRSSKQPGYSLRAFAKSLDVSPALLSLVLNNRRAPSRVFVEKVEAATGLRSPTESMSTNARMEEIESSAGWISYALLSLLETFDFQVNEGWIARRLRISVFELRDTVQKLTESGLLSTANRVWKQTTPAIRVNNSKSTAHTRRFQRELIERSLDSLDRDPPEMRDHSSITFAVNTKDLPAIKDEIRKFRIHLSEKYEQRRRLDEVYNLTVQFTPLTKR